MFGNYAIPKDGFTGHGGPNGYTELAVDTTFNVAPTSSYAKIYPLGTIVGYYNATLKGYGACAYLQYNDGQGDVACTIGKVATPYIATTNHPEYGHYIVTCDVTDGAVSGRIAVALGTVTSTYYAWFWIKGVCPDEYTSSTDKLAAQTTLTSAGSVTHASTFTAGADGAIKVTAAYTTAGSGMTMADDSTNANTWANISLSGFGWGI